MADAFSSNSYNKIKRLSTEELEKLWYAFLQDKGNKKLRDQLIVQYIYLTKYVMGRIKGTLPPSFSIDDITGYGVEGLIDAIEKYSPEKGARFETYAIMRIRGCIIDKIRAQDWMPRSTRKKIKDVKETAEKLRQELGRPATSTEIGEALGIEKEKVDSILAEVTSVSSIYDKKGTSDESMEIIDTIEDTKSLTPLEQLEEKDTKKELQMALKSLPERERMIMVLYYQKNMTLKEIGETIEISESRVCQIHAQAIMKLKNILSGKKTTKFQKI
ncbi:FliA/WhiG family RNA polymerase sigma factor [bacterium]|nr:FliA/WhiG family RNA polymerase sigma factor [bacterium]